MQELFTKYDRDRSNTIDAYELRSLLSEYGMLLVLNF